jgi:1,4-alpha-glucan branching enzyme
MIRCRYINGGDEVKVTFVVPVSDSEGQVAVVGDFNGWDPRATPAQKRQRQWTATVMLAPGRRYSFRYLAEGDRWFNDEEADDYQPNQYGGCDSVIDLSAVP